jgi:hypothetical protein
MTEPEEEKHALYPELNISFVMTRPLERSLTCHHLEEQAADGPNVNVK